MKFTTKLLFFWASIFLIFLMGIISVMAVFWGIQFNFWHLAVAFIINGILPPAIITSFFYKKLDYMESESLTPPNFKGMKSVNLPFKGKNKCSFDEMMHRIDRQYIISFSDREEKVLKFRTDTRMISWGIGGYVKMVDNENVQVTVYPVFGNSRREELYLNQTLRILHSVFNP
ncbi:MAG: hypothetical protein ACOH2V_10430 [Candidatus Saccharimonadaceae bacterium]